MPKETRLQITIIGSQQHGKTFWSEKYAEHYARTKGNVLVYNYGRNTDYSEHSEFKVLSVAEHKKVVGEAYNENEVFLFSYNGRIRHFRDFNKLFVKKRLRLKRIKDRKLERLFFDAIFLYVHSTLVIKDDVRPIFKYGMQEQAINLYSRRDHTGEFSSVKNGIGVDVILQFHSADSIPEEAYIYFTHLLLFRCVDLPKLGKVTSEILRKTMFDTFKTLSNPDLVKWTAKLVDLSPVNYCAVSAATFK